MNENDPAATPQRNDPSEEHPPTVPEDRQQEPSAAQRLAVALGTAPDPTRPVGVTAAD